MGDMRISINRRLIGLCAAICLLTAVVLFGVHLRSEGTEASLWAALGAFVRSGLFMGALWLAFPRGKRQIDVTLKTFIVILTGFAGIILRPKFFLPIVIVVGILALLLKPRGRGRNQKELSARYRND